MSVRIAEVQTIAKKIVGATCDGCGFELKPSMEAEHDAWDGAARVLLDGHGYGEYLDGYNRVECLLCKSCIRSLTAFVPCIAAAIERARP